MIREDDARLREAFEAAFADEPPVRATWEDVVRTDARRAARRWMGPRVIVLAMLALLAVPAALLAGQVWQLAVGSATPSQVRPLLGAEVNIGNSSPIAYLSRARVVARAESARGDIYLVEAPGRYPPGLQWHGPIRCFWLMASFRPADGSGHRVTVRGHAVWVSRLLSCSGVEKQQPVAAYEMFGEAELGARVVVSIGLVHAAEVTVSTRQPDGRTSAVPTWNGWYLAVLRDGDAADRATLVLRDQTGRDISPVSSSPTSP
jgi:hypothetical protein